MKFLHGVTHLLKNNFVYLSNIKNKSKMENKDLYHYESLNEMAFHYPELSKKDIQNIGAQHAVDFMAAADKDEFGALSFAERTKSFWDSFCEKLREEIVKQGFDDKFSAHGIEFGTRSTGDAYDWDLDEEYSRIKKQLKEREELLKLAITSENPIYDHQGVEVPRLPKKRAGYKTLTLKF